MAFKGVFTIIMNCTGITNWTGITNCTSKAMVYFDYPKPTSVALSYAGVMIYYGTGYVGLGSVAHTYKYTGYEYTGKMETRTVTLPVSLEPVQ